jgi:hypothetical protein
VAASKKGCCTAADSPSQLSCLTSWFNAAGIEQKLSVSLTTFAQKAEACFVLLQNNAFTIIAGSQYQTNIGQHGGSHIFLSRHRIRAPLFVAAARKQKTMTFES